MAEKASHCYPYIELLPQHVIRYIQHTLKMNTHVATDGRNSVILQRIYDEKLADRVVMDVPGPEDLYRKRYGKDVDLDDVARSMAIVTGFPDHWFETTIAPVVREKNEVSYLSVREAEGTARWIEASTASKKNRYVLRLYDPDKATGARYPSLDAMTRNMLLPYRSAARKHQVYAEIETA